VAPTCTGGGAGTAGAHSRSALSDALVHQGLAALRTSSLSLSPASPSSPSGLSPSAGGGAAPGSCASPATPRRSALTDALRQAGLAQPTPACS
jgi:hypothetical protein